MPRRERKENLGHEGVRLRAAVKRKEKAARLRCTDRAQQFRVILSIILHRIGKTTM